MKALAIAIASLALANGKALRAEDPVEPITEEVEQTEQTETGNEEAKASESTENGSQSAENEADNKTTTEENFDFGNWLSSVFTPEVIASILSVITSIGAILKLVSTMKDLAKQNKLSDQNIIDLTTKTVTEAINSMKDTTIEPLSKDLEKILPVLDKFAKIMALSQENTAESRTAILNLISELGVASSDTQVKEIAESAKEVVKTQTEEQEAKKEEQKATLESIEGYDGTSI